jgi:hypothetical protein
MTLQRFGATKLEEIFMYALAINGSPRKAGNTELLLREVLTELKDVGWDVIDHDN